MPRVQAIGVTKRFGDIVAARDIDLTVEDGEYVTILGPSGCGKTTLIKIISGIWEPTEGKVLIDGKDLAGVPTCERDVGYLFQNIALFPHLTAEENAGYSPFVHGGKLRGSDRASKAMRFVNIIEKGSRYPRELSTGDQQKAALARAIASGSRLLLLDEPLSALDARVRIDLRLELRRLVKDLGLTAIHVTHDQEEAMSISDRIVLMRSGRVIEVAKPEALYNDADSLFAQNFVGESNFILGYVESKSEGRTHVRLECGDVVWFDDSALAADAMTHAPDPGPPSGWQERGMTARAAWREMSHPPGTTPASRESAHPAGGRTAAPEFRPGDPAVVVVRPERLRLRQEKKGEHQEVPCTVDQVIFMGPYYRYAVKLSCGTRVQVDVFSTARKTFKSGQPAFLVLNTARCRLFPHPREGLQEVLRLE